MSFVVDWFLIFAVGLLILMLNSNFRFEYLIKPSIIIIHPVNVLLSIAFFVVFPFFKDCVFNRSSVGMYIFGLKVVDKESNERPTTKQLIIRNISFYVFFADMIAVLINKNQKLGDVWAHTKVVLKK